MTELDPSRAGRRARATYRSALMSDTKWRKVFSAIAPESCDYMVVKFIDAEEPQKMRFAPSLACPHQYMDTIEFGPTELRAIEWLELPLDLEPILAPIGRFPLEQTELGTRVVGYRR